MIPFMACINTLGAFPVFIDKLLQVNVKIPSAEYPLITPDILFELVKRKYPFNDCKWIDSLADMFVDTINTTNDNTYDARHLIPLLPDIFNHNRMVARAMKQGQWVLAHLICEFNTYQLTSQEDFKYSASFPNLKKWIEPRMKMMDCDFGESVGIELMDSMSYDRYLAVIAYVLNAFITNNSYYVWMICIVGRHTLKPSDALPRDEILRLINGRTDRIGSQSYKSVNFLSQLI
jgi:hypothetical protein